jgi:hypothetical protein
MSEAIISENIVVYISLLYFANQLGKKMSKFSLVESEYLRAIMVSGHCILKDSSTIPSTTISAIPK